MQTLQELQRKIKSADDLHSVVRTMKALAAVSIRQYEEAVASLSDYYRAVELGLVACLLNRPLLPGAKAPREAVICIFGSDQGMAGQFNEVILDFAERALQEGQVQAESYSYWVAGVRAAGSAEERFGPLEEFFNLPASAHLITGAVQDVLLRFDERRRERGEARLVLFHNVPTSGAAYRQRMVHLLPPDQKWLAEIGGRRWPGRCLPLFTLPGEELFSVLIGEYLFASLFRAFASSMAAENAARLASMQRAEKNIDEMKEDLTAQYHAQRQSAITEELFDVISGFEALTEKEEER